MTEATYIVTQLNTTLEHQKASYWQVWELSTVFFLQVHMSFRTRVNFFRRFDSFSIEKRANIFLLAKWWCNFKPFTMYTFIFTSPVELFFHIKIIHWTLLYSFPPEKVLRIRHFRNYSYTKMKAPFSLLTLFTRREGDPGAMEWYGGPKITRCLFSMSSCLIVRSSCQFVMSSCLPVVYSCRFVMLSCVQNK